MSFLENNSNKMVNHADVIGPRVLWDKMVDRAITRFEYTLDEQRLINDLVRLGFEEDQISEILADDDLGGEW